MSEGRLLVELVVSEDTLGKGPVLPLTIILFSVVLASHNDEFAAEDDCADCKYVMPCV